MADQRRYPTFCLLGATFETNNMGVSALSAGAIRCIIEAFPNAEIFLLDYGKESLKYNVKAGSRVIPVSLVNMRFSKKVYVHNNIAFLLLLSLLLRVIPFRRLKKRLISRNFCLRYLENADVVASVAGGDSFSDIYGLQRFFYVALPQLLALSMGKKLVLLPQTLGPFQNRVVKTVAKIILRHSSLVYSRDFEGLNEVEDFSWNAQNYEKFRFCHDMGFALEAARPRTSSIVGTIERFKKKGEVVGLNISGLLLVGGYTQDNMFGLKLDYREFIHRLIEFLIEKKGACVALVPHVFGGSDHLESDAAACKEIYDTLKDKYKDKIFLVSERHDQHEIKYIIGLCNFFIGSRMHSCIAALSQNIPAVGLAYSKKFRGVFDSIGFPSLVADPRNLPEEEIMVVINSAFERKEAIRAELEKKMADVRKSLSNLFTEIDELLLAD